MNKTLIALAFGLATLPAFSATTLRATVNGMVCAFCAQGIEKRIAKMDATKAVFVDLKNKTVAIEAKEGKALDQKAIAAEIADAGYDVVKMEPTTQSVAEIKAQLKAKK
ncbi:heavy-metal-associated domain-containing protein [Caenimonas sedimenti]|uniref:Heavy-metal-associated domain-containing protein n=1 Tax=Caenimonas sedimenti TaxID=2596921 RepID=A0A562ZXD6_9BURK|nr:cation transporter [Caenimonas sedimenti]TWO72955.1 heavy-metal-associated domain-containing protein [Caenimonas sedimenti]